MKRKEKFTTRILFNDNFLKIASLIAAILFWFVVVINVSPDHTSTVYGVPVNTSQSGTLLTSVGLHAISQSAKSVNVVVTGPRNLIGRLGSKDFTITPNLSNISKAGTYSVELSAILNSPDNRIRITKISPAYINVQFDTQITKTLPVMVDMQPFKVPKGYLMQMAQANPATVTVSGPTSELSKATQAVTYVTVKNNTTKTVVDKGNIVLLDSSGNKLDLSNMQLSSENVDVTVPVLKTSSVPLQVSFSNVPDGFDSSNINYTISPQTILIAGDEDKVDSMSSIALGDIDFSKLDITNQLSLNIPDLDGVMNVNNIANASVTVQLLNTSVKTMSTNVFSVVNVPAGYTVTNTTKQIGGIKLFGPSTGIGSVKTVTAVIDMSKVQTGGVGEMQVPVTIQVPGATGFWVTGNYTAVVDVRKKR